MGSNPENLKYLGLALGELKLLRSLNLNLSNNGLGKN